MNSVHHLRPLTEEEAFGDVLAGDVAIRNYLNPIKAHLESMGATEVWINRPGELVVQVGGRNVHIDEPSLTYEALDALATAVAVYAKQEGFGPASPLLSATLPDGERIQIAAPPAVEPGLYSITIRIPGEGIIPLADYQTRGAFDKYEWGCPRDYAERRMSLPGDDRALADALHARNLMQFLILAIDMKKTIAVVGDTGSGKTTLMKSLCQLIPRDERLITIEDVRELFLPLHDNRVHLLYSKGGQSVAKVSPSDLIASCMRMTPSRVLLAELRGLEAWDFLKLLTTGHAGSITSYHAESCELAYERFMFMAKENEQAASLSRDELKHLVQLTVDVVIHVTRKVSKDSDGNVTGVERYVDEVAFDPWAKMEAEFGSDREVQAGDRLEEPVA